eukprot:CAMPEP_0116912670 /NCGR_PEP_ID=MMETSP0467-20121206/16231_1 /TAXON_ID=283647 /ORGANISM="Mesodinium pulex, Strain SPMC105" /LENGTH=75 /DNA_ID=CAMNT_0004588707 /DNA_START=577 /DNA_END=804 /DNA_ORIENTATION=-
MVDVNGGIVGLLSTTDLFYYKQKQFLSTLTPISVTLTAGISNFYPSSLIFKITGMDKLYQLASNYKKDDEEPFKK